uniref:Uncharacterized protein n=1 Tax=Schistocephalus solidus TaxID=70667 RepID=A0A0V0J7S9_SCHSO
MWELRRVQYPSRHTIFLTDCRSEDAMKTLALSVSGHVPLKTAKRQLSLTKYTQFHFTRRGRVVLLVENLTQRIDNQLYVGTTLKASRAGVEVILTDDRK